MCRRFPVRFRVLWSGLWIRGDEFHPSLDIQVDHVRRLSYEEVEKYWRDLNNRRQIAHKRDLATP